MPTATKQEALLAFKTLVPFIGLAQRQALKVACSGEEKQHFFDVLVELAERVKTMPKTYEQDGKAGDAIVYLHYFYAGADWYILEKDSDPDGEGQVQAFGLADLFRDGGELGYISIPELLQNGVELDLYWTPRPLREVRAEREPN